MPDVFQVLKADHDTVKAMLDQLEDEPAVAPGATAEQLASRRETVDLVIIEETRHEAAEQEFLWPALIELLLKDGKLSAEVTRSIRGRR